MTTKYVIRRIDFSYNDEYYQTGYQHAGEIKAIYDNHEEATQAYKKLVVEALQDNDLEMYTFGYGELPTEVYEAVEAFVLEKTGEEYDKDDGLPDLNEEDLFHFAQLTGIVHYQLFELDDSQKLYVIWLTQDQAYYTDYEMGNIVYGQSENFMSDDELNWHFLDTIKTNLHGSLEELSDAPSLLEQVIKTHAGLNYDAHTATLKMDSLANYDAIAQLNALLKAPLFEIQAKTLEEFQAL